jgi:hypothetical protein
MVGVEVAAEVMSMVVANPIDTIFEKILCLGDYAFVLRTSQPLFS